MGDVVESINAALLKIVSKLKEEFQYEVECEEEKSKRIKLSEPEPAASTSVDSSFKASSKAVITPLPGSEVCEMMACQIMTPWEESLFYDAAESFILRQRNCEALFKNHALLHSLWQRLHTGLWIEVSLTLRAAFTMGSIILVGHMLRELQDELENHGNNTADLPEKSWKIVLACDRGLLMGKPIANSPLTEIAAVFNKYGSKSEEEFNEIKPPDVIEDFIPIEATPFTDIKLIECKDLPFLQEFLLNYMEKSLPLKIQGMTKDWPAMKKWNFKYFDKIAGSRTVPVEVGLRYSDSEWSQRLMTISQYMSACTSEDDNKENVYLAQHQLIDQIPELLSDVIIPDYCHMGQNDPVINAWIGPKGTITPLHNDPDHNILVQVYGYKVLLIFPESDSEFLYPFENNLLNNTSQINLDEVATKLDVHETWPLLKNAKGFYVILSPGDALYIPPKCWHYVRSLSNSISLSFWWR